MALASSAEEGNPFKNLIDTLPSEKDNGLKFFNPVKLEDPRYEELPLSIRVLLEASIRNCDGFYVKKEDAFHILDWRSQQNAVDVPFVPARVLFQDFTGIPAMVDLAAMREAVAQHDVNPDVVNPKCPTYLLIDNALPVDFNKCVIRNAPNPGGGGGGSGGPGPSPLAKPTEQGSQCGSRQRGCSRGACSDPPSSTGANQVSVQIENTPLLCPFHLQPVSEPETTFKNQEMEVIRNKERLQFLKWCSRAFQNVKIIPPDVGTPHQVNLEFSSTVVQQRDGLLFPDSVVGTDSHTTMINGLGTLGWGVGGIESEAVMLGQPVSLPLPKVVGCKLMGSISTLATSIDIVLGITKHLRQANISGKFVEFFGPGVSQLSASDRTTIANMCPEYNATVSFFPVDEVTLNHLKHTNFSDEEVSQIETYLKAVKLFRSDEEPCYPQYSEVIEIDLGSIIPHVSGPKRPQDRVAVTCLKEDFLSCLKEKVGFKGFNVPEVKRENLVPFLHAGKEYQLAHGSVVIAAVISCTNNCNPSVMLTAGLLAQKAVEAGLAVKPYIRTSLAPGNGMVTHYLNISGVLPFFSHLGFEVVGYGCSTCVGNTAPLPDSVKQAISKGDLIACGVLSGNRNFEGRLCERVKANYLASPPLVVAYAIAGTVSIDFQQEPIGVNSEGKEVFLADIWPSRAEVQQIEEMTVVTSMFTDIKKRMEGGKFWNSIECPDAARFPWDVKSTYIHCPPFFNKLSKDSPSPQPIENAYALLFLGDKVTTDHISPAGSIPRVSAAAKYLQSKRLTPREFNSYGARRGNDAVMTRGTFASVKLQNRFIGKPGPKTLHIPSGQTLDVFEASERYQRDGIPLIILAGKDYGAGSSRDWAAKGPYLLGVRAVIAESFEKIHKNHLVGVGIAPLQFAKGENADTLELSGKERFTISIPKDLSPLQQLTVKTSTGKTFNVTALFEGEMDLVLYRHGGTLKHAAHEMLLSSS